MFEIQTGSFKRNNALICTLRCTARYTYMSFMRPWYQFINNQKHKISQHFSGGCVGCVQEWYLLKAICAFLYALCRFDILELGRRLRGQQASLFQSHLLLPLSSLAILSCDELKSSSFQPEPSALQLAALSLSSI